MLTDGRIAVLQFNACDKPLRSDTEDTSLPEVAAKGSLATRALRDTDLALRNDFFRGNILYQGYFGVKMGMGMAHKKAAVPGQTKVVHYGGEDFEVVSGADAIKPPDAPKDAAPRYPTSNCPASPTPLPRNSSSASAAVIHSLAIRGFHRRTSPSPTLMCSVPLRSKRASSCNCIPDLASGPTLR